MMRFTAEYLENTKEVLLRFLSTSENVQIGTYSIDGTPRIPEIIDVDILSDAIKEGEAHFYLKGFYPYPEYIEITLPDASKQTVKVEDTIQHPSSWQPIVEEQPVDTVTPIEPEPRRSGESAGAYKPEAVLPPDYPDLWVELALERTDPVKLGANLTSDPLIYTGGGTDRALSATQRQAGVNVAPYLNYAPTRLEGAFTNSLIHSDFAYDISWSSPYFDALPNGWSVDLADPMSLLRMQADNSTAIPSFTLRYRQRVDVATSSPVTIITPPVNVENDTFQVIIVTGARNSSGSVQLKTEDEAVSSAIIPLTGTPVLATLNIGSHTGRVKMVWNQSYGEGDEQILQLVAPCASNYVGGHSWIPYSQMSAQDVITLNNISFNKPWYFYKGAIRVDSLGDIGTQPLSWEIKTNTATLLKVDEGVLSSSYSTSSIQLSSYLPSVLRYKLKWTPTTFIISDFENTKATIPFTLDFPSLVGLTSPLFIILKGYKANEGSHIAKRWVWLPS